MKKLYSSVILSLGALLARYKFTSSKPNKVIIGKQYKYKYKFENPFKSDIVDTYKVKNISNGYVLYYSHKYDCDESMLLSRFVEHCTLIDNIGYDNNSK